MGFRGRPDSEDLLRMGAISLGLHILLVIFLSLNPWPVLIKAKPIAYTVTLVPVSIPEPETRFKQIPLPETKKEKVPEIKREKKKPITKPKKDDIVEKVKKSPKKVEKPEEKKIEKPEEKKADLKHLQEALEELRKKIAMDEIKKKVARREKVEERPTPTPPPVPVISATKSSAEIESKLSQYYSLIWAEIKKAWTIPENLLKERVDLETIIIVIIESDGKIRRTWFEKKSGDDLYDQMAMRALIRAEPLPPIPKELGEDSLEIGIRFHPD